MIGKLIKAFAIIILIACIALSLFYGLQLLENIDEGVGLVVILAGCIVGLFSFAMLFGYGHLIDTNAEMNKKMDRLIDYTGKLLSQSRHNISYNVPMPSAPAAPVVPAPVAPVAPVPPVAPVIEEEPTITIPPSTPAAPAADSLDDTVVLPADVQSVAKEVSGWTCTQCGAQHTNITAFCKFCGKQRV